MEFNVVLKIMVWKNITEMENANNIIFSGNNLYNKV